MQKILSALALAAAAIAPAQAALTAGDIAIIGRINNGSPDSFAVVALNNIAAGEVIYFTDNGWTGSGYRGASATDGDGNENLTKWVVAAYTTAGTVINSTSSAFTVSGSIAGSTSGAYASLALSGAPGDQIYAFQGAASNPLNTVASQNNLYVLDDTNGFEASTSSNTGGIATGLEEGKTAVTLNLASTTSITVKGSVLSGPAKSKEQWLATFADKTNWEAGALPTASIAVAVPEPQTYALLLAGLGAIGFTVRRRTVR